MKHIHRTILLVITSIVFLLIANQSARAATRTWDGSSSTNWGTAANWTPEFVPLITDDVVIPDMDTTPNDPTVSSGAVCNNLTIDLNGLLTGGTNNLTVAGNLVKNGVFSPTPGSTVTFTGSSATISGLSAANFYNLVINSSGTVTVNPAVFSGVFNNLTVTGTLSIASGKILNVFGSSSVITLSNASSSITGSGNVFFYNCSPTITLNGGSFAPANVMFSLDYNGSYACTIPAIAYGGTGLFKLSANGYDGETYTFTMGSGTFSTGGDFEISVSEDEGGSNVTAILNNTNTNMTIGGSWSITKPDAGFTITYTKGTETVTFNNASGTKTIDPSAGAFQNLIFSNAGTKQLTNNLTASGTLQIQNTAVLSLNGKNLTVSGVYSNDGTLQLNGDETTVSLTNDSNSGLTKFVKSTGTITIKNLTPYYNLEFDSNSGGDGNAIFTLPAAIDVNNNLTITDGTLDVSGSNFQVNVGGSWINPSSETFESRSGTVVFDGTNQTISGSTTFYNFSKTESTNNSTDVTLTFDHTGTQTIGGLLTLDGLDDDDRINLVSDSPGTQWFLTCNGTFAIDYVDVQDSNASGGVTVPAGSTSVEPGDNNNNWTFGIVSVSVTLRDAGDTGDYTTWAMGSGKEINTVYLMDTGNCVLVKNDGNVAEDFSIEGAGTNWALGSAIGEDTCVLMGLFNGESAPIEGDFSTTYDIINGTARWATVSGGNGNYEGARDGDSVAAGSGEKLYIYLKTPSSVTSGLLETITVTIGSREHTP